MGHGPFHLVLRLKESTVRFWFDFCIAVFAKKRWRRKEKHRHVQPVPRRERQSGWAQPATLVLSAALEKRGCLSKS